MTPQQSICYAELETRNFKFQAVGFSHEEVCRILKDTFETHIKKNRGTLTWEDVAADVYVRTSEVAKGWVS